MTETLKVAMRSPLGRARGRGAARSGIHHWLAERITAVALIPLTLWFIYVVFHLMGRPQWAVARWASNPVNTVLALALIVMTFRHMQLGLEVVMGDYLPNKRMHTAAVLVNRAVTGFLALLCAVSVLRLAFLG